MRYSSQNLTDGRLPKFWSGRAWWRTDDYKRTIHWEWAFGKLASGLALKVQFGGGDGDDGILFHAAIPFLFSVFFGWDGFLRCRECQTGFAIHSNALWIYPLTFTWDSSKDHGWWRRNFHWEFPWSLTWVSTEILTHDRPSMAKPVWKETKENRNFMERWSEREAIARDVSKDYPYSYILKNRNIQHTTATVYVERRTWRARWWWLFFWVRKVQTCIDVKFKQEVGEGAGSYKGGTVGCGYEMKWNETPERCLSRMEHEREFRR